VLFWGVCSSTGARRTRVQARCRHAMYRLRSRITQKRRRYPDGRSTSVIRTTVPRDVINAIATGNTWGHEPAGRTVATHLVTP